MTHTTNTTIRTYETFEVRWYDEGEYRSTWSNYSRDEAERLVATSARHGEIVRKTFEVTIRPEHAHLYKPGFADRAVTA